MIRAYRDYYSFCVNGIVYQKMGGVFLEEESKVKTGTETIKGNWNTLKEIEDKFYLILPFLVEHHKKGRVIKLYDRSLFDRRTWNIKENKKELFLTISIYTKDVSESVSLKTLSHYPAEQVKKFLKTINN